MASTYTTSFGIEKIATGEQAGTWGTTTNHNADILDRIASYTAVALSGTTHTLTVREASPGSGTENLQDGMYRVIKFTGALGANNTVTIAPNTAKAWFIENATTDSGSSGPYTVILTQGSGANVTVQNGKNAIIYCDGGGSGAIVYDALADLQVGTLEVTGAAAIDGAAQFSSTVTVGVDDTGYDVKFFGATSGAYMLWDESADDLKLVGAAGFTVAGDIDVDGTTNLDAVDIDGNAQLDGTLSVGVDDTGKDVKFFGATSGKYWLWDESADGVVAVSDLQQTGTLTVGVDDTGHDVKFFGATSGKYMLWDESADSLIVTGVSSFDGKTTINETGADVDFRVESNSQQFALYVNGGLNHVAVGYNAEPTVTNLGIAILSADANGGVLLVKEDGSNPSSGEGLGSFGMRGEDSANNLAASSAMMSAYASENHSGSAAGANLRFYTKGNGVGPGSAPSERARITQAGEVLIAGTTDNGAYNLQCMGTGVWGAGAYVNGSDERLKENIADLGEASGIIASLRPITFSYKSNYSSDSSIQPGFIAQELQQALSGEIYVEGVVTKGEKYLNVAYQTLIPVLTKSLQEALEEIDKLKARVSAVEKGNS